MAAPSFIHPGLAAAALGLITIPILLHLLSRHRYRREPWAAMAFLRRAHRRMRRRLRIERWLLLLLRTAAMALIALALARPLLNGWAAARSPGTSRTDRIIIIDDSGSMRALRDDGSTSFETARRAALRQLEGLGPADGVAIVTASSSAHPRMEQPTYDHALARRILSELRCGYGPTDLAAAFDTAARVLNRSDLPPSARTACVLTDFAARDWAAPTSGGPSPVQQALTKLGTAASVQLVNLGPTRRDNLAVTGLICRDLLVGPEFPATFAFDVTNFGMHPARNAKFEVRIDGIVVRTMTVDPIDPGAKRSDEFRLQLDRFGSHVVSVGRVGEPDALAADDVRFVSVDASPGVRILLVDGKPGPGAASETFYLTRALAPISNSHEPGLFDPLTITDLDLPAASLNDVGVVVLANVRSLPEPQWDRLERFVRAGGGMFVVAGDQILIDDYRRNGSELLPVTFDSESADALPAEDNSRESHTLRIADATHPILADLVANPDGGLLSARFTRQWKTAPVSGARTILAFDNGLPAFVERRLGAGRILVWTSSANMAWNNLPAKPDYVALLFNLMAYLAPRPGAHRNGSVGDELLEPIDASAARNTLRVRPPSGPERPVAASWRDGRLVVPIARGGPDAGGPGTYELRIGHAVRRACLNVDPSESDLRSVAPVRLKAELNRNVVYLDRPAAAVASAAAVRSIELTDSFFGALLAVVLIETLCAAWFGSSK